MSYWDVFEIAPIFLIHLGLFLEVSIWKTFFFLKCPFCRSAYLCTSINRTWIQVNEPSILGWIIIRDDAREKSILWVTFHRFCCALPVHVCVLTQSTRLSSLLNSNIMFSSVQREVVFQNVSSWCYYCLPDYRSSSSRLSFTTLILWSVKVNTS